ncbi:MAG: type IV secretion system protein [Campylobacteraceae bacterium]|jgi:hypothetical protein|nr:type IV secretion system protein [Campylobacteraceae bacterium]
MKFLKSIILGFSILVFAPSVSYAQGGGILVSDLTSNYQQFMSGIKNAQEYVREAQRWIGTINHYKAQAENFKKQIDKLSESDKFIAIFNQAVALLGELEHIGKLFGNISAIVSGNGSLHAKAVDIRKQFDTYDSCSAYGGKTVGEENAIKACTLLFNAEYMDITGVMDLKEKLEAAGKTLRELVSKSNALGNATSAKSSQDLSNMLIALQLELQTKKDQLESFNLQMKALKEIAKNTLAQFKVQTSKSVAGLEEYGKDSKEE